MCKLFISKLHDRKQSWIYQSKCCSLFFKSRIYHFFLPAAGRLGSVMPVISAVNTWQNPIYAGGLRLPYCGLRNSSADYRSSHPRKVTGYHYSIFLLAPPQSSLLYMILLTPRSIFPPWKSPMSGKSQY